MQGSVTKSPYLLSTPTGTVQLHYTSATTRFDVAQGPLIILANHIILAKSAKTISNSHNISERHSEQQKADIYAQPPQISLTYLTRRIDQFEKQVNDIKTHLGCTTQPESNEMYPSPFAMMFQRMEDLEAKVEDVYN